MNKSQQGKGTPPLQQPDRLTAMAEAHERQKDNARDAARYRALRDALAKDALWLDEVVYWRLPPDSEGFQTRRMVRELAERLRKADQSEVLPPDAPSNTD